MLHPGPRKLPNDPKVENIRKKTIAQVKVRISKKRLKELMEHANSNKFHVDIGQLIIQECQGSRCDARKVEKEDYSDNYKHGKYLETISEEEHEWDIGAFTWNLILKLYVVHGLAKKGELTCVTVSSLILLQLGCFPSFSFSCTIKYEGSTYIMFALLHKLEF